MDTPISNPIGTTHAGRNIPGLLGAAAAGAALTYFFDPDRGARRRSLVSDQIVHARRRTGDAVGTTTRDLGNRARGLAAATRSRFAAAEAPDERVAARVRTELGRAVSHPRAITVTAEGGRVTLAGPVLSAEVDALLRRVRGVRGVIDVVNQLEVHERPGDVPALQGGAPRPDHEFELLQENWTPAARLLVGVAGGALALAGTRRRSTAGALLGLTGLALLARGASNSPLRQLAGAAGRRGVNIDKVIDVNAPVADVFGYLTEWERWPQWMSHVRSVAAIGPRGAVGERTHWVVDGPAGTTVEWDAETTDFQPHRLVAWQSVAGSMVEHAGQLLFAPNADGSTRVQVRMSYAPPAGAAGHAVAKLFGRAPDQQMDDDLLRVKTTIETGAPPRDAARAEV